MEEFVEDILHTHCACATENRIVIEAVSVCPDCFAFFSTTAYKIPRERVREVLRRIDDVMQEMGIKHEPTVSVSRRPGEAGAVSEPEADTLGGGTSE